MRDDLSPWRWLAELSRLSEIAKSLVKLYREETALLRGRDELIAQLRKQGVPWSTLATRTGLSRQALSELTSQTTPSGFEEA